MCEGYYFYINFGILTIFMTISSQGSESVKLSAVEAMIFSLPIMEDIANIKI
jgi:hypothetical protein